ncbi:MAG: hypothetical protein VX768_20990 [Planctomycetota bacterium]|nr:hypothetical protein [Planctomycetota bacterium]
MNRLKWNGDIFSSLNDGNLFLGRAWSHNLTDLAIATKRRS